MESRRILWRCFLENAHRVRSCGQNQLNSDKYPCHTAMLRHQIRSIVLLLVVFPLCAQAQIRNPSAETATIIQRAPVPASTRHDPGCDHPRDVWDNNRLVSKCTGYPFYEDPIGWTWYAKKKYREEACGSLELSAPSPEPWDNEGTMMYRCPPLVLKNKQGVTLYARPEDARKHCRVVKHYLWNNQGMYGGEVCIQ